MPKYLHTMIRVRDIDETVRFFNLLGLQERRRTDNEKGRFTLVFLAAPGDEDAQVELTYNWDPQEYSGGRNFGHLAYQVENIYETCQRLRSEEHTSELQSLMRISYAVFCLKKKTKRTLYQQDTHKTNTYITN